MLRALLYLRLTSLKNLLRSRARRLRQPKYLAGAVVGAIYFYFVFFHHIGREPGQMAAPGMIAPGQVLPADTRPLMMALGSLALLAVTFFMWVLPSQKPGLSFSQAEIAFLFSAPVSRRALIHYKLLSSQVSVLLQSIFFSIVFNARSLSSGRALPIVVGWWLILTLVNLHYTGCSLTLARLIERGVSAFRRRLWVLGGLGAVAAIMIIWFWRQFRGPAPSDLGDIESTVRWLVGVLDAGLLHGLLMPYKWVLAPFFAEGLREFAFALGPAVGLLLVHYFWVLNMEVSFEEASLALAEKREIRRAGLRSGNYRFGEPQRKARRGPFNLRETGWPEIAFLWKNLLSTLSFLNARTWLVIAVIIVVGSKLVSAQGAMPQRILSGVGIAAVIAGLYVIAFGPLLVRLDLRSDLAHADILKTYPLPGWRIVLGELLTPIAILTGVIWLVLLAVVCALQPTDTLPWLDPSLRLTYAACSAALAPVLITLQLLVPNAAAIVFPAWFQATRAFGGGIELMGQRLIFVFGQMLIILLALIPAAGTAALLIFITQHLIGTSLAVIFATVVVIAILAGEVWCGLWWLGERFERFDLSSEQRP